MNIDDNFYSCPSCRNPVCASWKHCINCGHKIQSIDNSQIFGKDGIPEIFKDIFGWNKTDNK